jgi:signal transduction histidine kinase/ActR/RegA family two-component response regulator
MSAIPRTARLYVLIAFACNVRAAALQDHLPLLTRVGMIHELSAAQAELHYPVLLRAVVTYTDPAGDMLFVQDESGGVYVDITPPYHSRLQFGQQVEVQGVTAPGYFAPMVIEPKVRVVGPGTPPRPAATTIQSLVTGGNDSQWIETRGVVRSVSVQEGRLQITLAEANAKIEVLVRDFGKVPPLVDCLVTVRGVAGGVFNDKGQLIGTQLYLGSLAQVGVDEQAAADPFATELRPIQRILQFVPRHGYGHRVRIRGTVAFQRPGVSLYVHDESAGIYVSSSHREQVRPGDVVEVAGFPEAGGYTPVLRNAVYRRVASGPPPQPTEILPDLALKGAYDTELIEIEGRLISAGRVADEFVYVLQSGYVTFNAHLAAADGEGLALVPGALIRVAGICSVQVDEVQRPRSFRLLLRDKRDVTVVDSPPWWSLRHTLLVVGILVGIVLAALAWVVVLDRRIKVQTGTIRERLEREAALEQRLQQAQKMEAIGRLAGGIAHDFNNLLTAILGYTELVTMQLPRDNPVTEELGEIRRAGERASALTRQLLAFSRRQVLQPKVLDLNTVIRDMSRMLARLIGEHIELVSVLEPRLGTVKADPSQLEQVLMNLAVNARDAMPEGGTVTVETGNVEPGAPELQGRSDLVPGPYIRLLVTDTGCGMDEETQNNIFEPFFTTKGVGHGTGLGLATVYGIVRQSGGDIAVRSKVGEGTTFITYLPQVSEQVEPEIAAEIHMPATGRETILVVEDEQALRALIKAVLGRSGYQVLEAQNGEEALELISQNRTRIDLVATDVIMPKMGGVELVERLMHVRPDTKILFLSGYTDDAITTQGVFNEESPFLQKPFTPDALACKVREVLDSPSAN